MKKNTKRILTLVMAVLMLTALCTTAFADDPTINVYIRLQTADVPDDWDFTLGDLEDVEYITPYSTGTEYFVAIPVTLNTTIYVKDIVNQFLGNNIEACTYCGTYGCVHEGTPCCNCTTCNCTWKQVHDYYDSTIYRSVLNSILYLNQYYTNNSVTTGDSTHGSYSGTSWEYFVADSINATAVYPENLYMDQYQVNSSIYITLSFDTSSFTW